MTCKILMIDNQDSFTFNIAEALERLGASVRTVRNEIAAENALEQARQANAMILISPGPGRPEDAGCSMDLVRLANGKVPLFGVCLGHQAMVLEAGGEVVRAPEPVHGKTSLLNHDATGPFAEVPNPIKIGRYHSLCTPNPPPPFHVHAAIEGMAMPTSDKAARQVALQFHPPAVLTPGGQHMLASPVDGVGRGCAARP